MPSPLATAATVVWSLVVVAIATDWRDVRSQRPYAYPLLAVGGLLYVIREWAAALWTLAPTAELALSLGSNLAFLGVIVLLGRRWLRARNGST